MGNYLTMDDWQSELLLAILLVVIVWVVFKYINTPKNLPPGPRGLPFFGCKLLLGDKPHLTVANMKKEYGDVIRMDLGMGFKTVFLNSYKSIKEALVKNADMFSNRPQEHLIKEFNDAPGIIRSNGEIWSDIRRFSLSTLRDFGFGKSTLEPQIKEEIHHYLKELEAFQGKPIPDIGEFLRKSVTNVICIVMTGRRFDYKHKLFNQLLDLSHEHLSLVGVNRLASLVPRPLRYKFVFKMLGLKSATFSALELMKVLSKIVEEFESKHEAGNQNNFIDAWLTESAKDSTKEKTLTKNQLATVLFDLFLAGSDTTTNTLGWCILYMMEHPEIQAKIQLEIDNVIGKERTPSLSDQKLMPYTEATIMEVSRIVTIVPLSLIHSAKRDTQLLGFNIPKDTLILPNLWAVHHDPEIFSEPEKFSPERFLTDNAQLKRMEELIPFSMGKRQCMGESLARMELFLYFTSMLQHFTFKNVDDTPVDFSYNYAIVTMPTTQPICAIPRS